MDGTPFLQLVCSFSIGLSLLLIGVACIVLRSTWARALSSFTTFAVVLASAWLLADDVLVVARSAAWIGLILFLFTICVSPVAARFGFVLIECIRRPRVRWSSVSMLGAALAIGSVVAYEQDEEMRLDQSMHELEECSLRSPLLTANRPRAVTDRGTEIVLLEPREPRTLDDENEKEMRLLEVPMLRYQVIRYQTGNNLSNCHGWAFTGGQYWICGIDVDMILAENDYQSVEQPQPHDLVIYRDDVGVNHTGIVRYVTDGLPVLAEGKWGCNGVYLHAVDRSCYGTTLTYYRSSRPGHILRGLDNPGPSQGGD